MNLSSTQNLLDSIESNLYHSAISLGYNIDIEYYDTVIIPSLRRKRILNNICLIDARKLSQALRWANLSESNGGALYTMLPVKTEGAFHPKVILAFGEDHVFVAVGSGNPTVGGYNSNLEVWYSFRLHPDDHKMHDVFYQLWSHCRSLALRAGSRLLQTKLSWIEDYCKYCRPPEINLNSNVSIVGIGSSSILREIEDAISSSEVKEITIVSPFFDSDFRTLNFLATRYHPQAINLILQKDFTSLPSIASLKSDIFKFHLVPEQINGASSLRPLHAKIYEFQLSTGTILLIGSANCSEAALGTTEKRGKNSEICILMKTDGKCHYYIKNMGFRQPLLREITRTEVTQLFLKTSPDAELEGEWSYHIASAELRSKEILLKTNKRLDESVLLEIQIGGKRDSLIPEFRPRQDIYACKFSRKIEEAAILTLVDRKLGLPISNTVFLFDVAPQLRFNPDPRYREIQEIISQIREDDDVWDLMNLLNRVIDHGSEQSPEKVAGKITKQIENDKNDSEEGNQLTPEEFSELHDSEEFLNFPGLSRNSVSEFLEALRAYINAVSLSADKTDQVDEEEATDIDEKAAGDEKESEREYSHSHVRSEAKAASAFFINYLKKIPNRHPELTSKPDGILLHHVISYLLLVYNLKEYKIKNQESFERIIPVADPDSYKDFLTLGLAIVGNQWLPRYWPGLQTNIYNDQGLLNSLRCSLTIMILIEAYRCRLGSIYLPKFDRIFRRTYLNFQESMANMQIRYDDLDIKRFVDDWKTPEIPDALKTEMLESASRLHQTNRLTHKTNRFLTNPKVGVLAYLQDYGYVNIGHMSNGSIWLSKPINFNFEYDIFEDHEMYAHLGKAGQSGLFEVDDQ